MRINSIKPIKFTNQQKVLPYSKAPLDTSNKCAKTFVFSDLTPCELRRVIERDLISQTKNCSVIKNLAKLDDKRFRAIREFAVKIYTTFDDNDYYLYVYDPSKDIINDYQEGKITVDELFRAYSFCKICELTKDENSSDYSINQAKNILELLSNSGVESSNTAMLLDLIKDKKISKNILDFCTIESKLSYDAESDLDKLLSCIIENKEIKGAFVPKFETKKDALKHASIGDVFDLNGENFAYIKTQNGIEKLNITSNTYLKLFPPIERFCATQNDIGDCFLLSVLFTAYSNPNTRYSILKLFKDNDDGTTDVEFCSRKGFEYTLKDVFQQLENAQKNSDYSSTLSKSCPAYAIFEILWDKTLENIADIYLKSLYETALNKFNSNQFKNNINTETITVADEDFSQDELDLLLQTLKLYTEGKINIYVDNVLAYEFDRKLCFKNNPLQVCEKNSAQYRNGGIAEFAAIKLGLNFIQDDKLNVDKDTYALLISKNNLDNIEYEEDTSDVKHAYCAKIKKGKTSKTRIYNPYNTSREVTIKKNKLESQIDYALILDTYK